MRMTLSLACIDQAHWIMQPFERSHSAPGWRHAKAENLRQRGKGDRKQKQTFL
jgi:hypothetical protein